MDAMVEGLGASFRTRRKGEASVLRDFEAASDLLIYEEFGQDIAEIAEVARYIDSKGLLHAVALAPYGVGAIVDAWTKLGSAGRNASLAFHRAGSSRVPTRRRSANRRTRACGTAVSV